MVSLHVSNIVLSLLIFILNFIELNASRQVTLTCGSDQTTQRGLPGYPGKRGPGGETGAPGPKGHRGWKGDPGQCPDLCAAALNRISLLEEKSNAFNKCLLSCVNGKCVNEDNTYVCLCSSGYAGTNCTDDFCDDPPCPANSHCTGPNQCTCDDGYQLSKGTCKAVCFGEHSCGDRGVCISPGKCRCISGYTGSFSGCQAFACNEQPCGLHSHCSGPNQCSCDEGYLFHNEQCTVFSDCTDLSRAGYTRSGIYNITVAGRSNQDQVYCDLNTDDGDWLVFQRRIDGSVEFYRDWVDYQNGFGDLNGEFWLGLDFLHAITTTKSFQLRVDLEDWDGNTAYALYRHFSVGNSQSNYQLNVINYSGTAGDSLHWHNNRQFSTKDRDNDVSRGHCAQRRHGAWWYRGCEVSNLNGEYLRNGVLNNRRGVTWNHWKNNYYSMKQAEMKIKRN